MPAACYARVDIGKSAVRSHVELPGVSARPFRDATEQAKWDRLMDAHHYPGFRCLFGGGLRHVAETSGGRWVALVGWAPGAFKIKARDAWIGWAPEQQFGCLSLVANNTRFLVLPGFNGGNLASRVLSLSLRRVGTKGTRLARAQCTTLRLKLLKIAVQVKVTARRVWLSYAQSHAYPKTLMRALAKLQRYRVWRPPG